MANETGTLIRYKRSFMSGKYQPGDITRLRPDLAQQLAGQGVLEILPEPRRSGRADSGEGGANREAPPAVKKG